LVVVLILAKLKATLALVDHLCHLVDLLPVAADVELRRRCEHGIQCRQKLVLASAGLGKAFGVPRNTKTELQRGGVTIEH
jgi:hypothetical protein